MSPRVVIGAPLYGKARWLPEAIESLLAQTFTDFALVLIDDRSPDDTLAVARGHADPRVEVHENPVRLGMLGNTNRAFTLPLERHPEAEFFALASDHDVWDPRWLETLVGLLDAHPDAVAAYPQTRRIDEDGAEYRQKPPWRFDTRGIADRRARLRRAVRGMAAGDMIYGLIRADAVRAVGAYKPLLIPDRLLLAELALRGTFAQADAILWRRRFRGLADLDRQKRLFWPDGDAPPWVDLPWWAQHSGAMAWTYVVEGRPGIGRAEGAALAATYLDASLRHRAWRRWRRARTRVIRRRDALLGPPVRAALERPAVRRVVRERVVPGLEATERVLAAQLEERR